MSAGKYQYQDVILEIKSKIGVLKLNRPKSLNAFGGNLVLDIISALRELDEHPETVFTVLTGEGRFFSSGADVKAHAGRKPLEFPNPGEKKVHHMAALAPAMEMLRAMITHSKVLVLALNGPAVGGGAAWFPGVADLVLAAEGAWLQVPFSQLGLVPEFGSATHFAQSMGVHRANDFLMLGRKLTVEEMEQWGLVNRVFPAKNFQGDVMSFLEQQLEVNDGKSMMEAKRLSNSQISHSRLLAVYEATSALAERMVEDAPTKRFQKQKEMLDAKAKGRSKL